MANWRNTSGVLPWREGDELPEVAVRRMRSGVHAKVWPIQEYIEFLEARIAVLEKHATDDEAFRTSYHDLIMAVGTKHEGETRHETARRYIEERERQMSGPHEAHRESGEDLA